ncbi:AMP-binding protein [Pseudonocardia acaciae]|uniref:AMP-binding protein n=1 Tax=Pseudonocardia acaciae TaxID=551276 RepID=UPI00055F6971|nr:AMP-binding protein [Pseudonocardia acaciae]
MSLTLRSLFVPALNRFNGRPALRFDGRVTSYADLVADADRLAHVLVAAGVTPGAPVAIMMSNRAEWVVADQAVIRAGGAKVPVNDMLSAPEIAYVLRDSGAVVALADEGMADAARAAGVRRVIAVGPDWDAALAAAPTGGPPKVEVAESDVGLIMYTGGTTGRQKGVVHTQRGLAVNLLAHVVETGLLDDERLLLTSPLPHSAGFLAQAGLLKGALAMIEPRFDADLVLDRIERDRATFLFMVPTMIYRMLDAAERRTVDLSSLRTILYGAAPITLERLEQGLRRLGPVFMQLYGQTEAPNFLTRLTREEHDLARPDRLTSCGRPATMVRIAVLDEAGEPVPPGTPGEICARAPYVMAGYHGLAAKTAETLRGGWLHTGDLGILDDDGYVHLLDRKNDMIISGGMNVYSTEVENVLQACPGVGQVAVVGVPHPDWGEAVVAFVVPADGEDFDEPATVARCRAELAAYKRPKAYRLLGSLPVTAFGKVDKKALRAG